jgi:hypothetical protein
MGAWRGTKAWARRWQEFIGWLPLLVVVAVFGWVMLGGITDRSDLIRWLLELPVLTAYALAALGAAFLARRRQRRKLTKEESAALWQRTLAGDRGALIIYLTDTFVWALTYALSLWFFWPRR